MSNAPILASHGWHRYEAKTLVFTVVDDAGAAKDVSAYSLSWRLFADDTVLLTKTTAAAEITIGGGSNNEVSVAILASDYSTIPEGYYRFELWDLTNNLLLSFGGVELLVGTDPS